MKTRVSLKYFVNDSLWNPFFDCTSSQTPSKLTSLTILETLRSFTLFSSKIRAVTLQEGAKICLRL